MSAFCGELMNVSIYMYIYFKERDWTNCVQRFKERRLKTAKSKIVDSCELDKANINNVPLTSEIADDCKRSSLRLVTSHPEFKNESFYLMHHSEVGKKKVETFNTEDKNFFSSGKLT